jgi:hypothetical protein
MSSPSPSKADTYQCAHCKLVNHGVPAEIVIIENQVLTMCCLGCACAAKMFVDLYHAGLQPKTF